jgi:hypothetical protein
MCIIKINKFFNFWMLNWTWCIDMTELSWLDFPWTSPPDNPSKRVSDKKISLPFGTEYGSNLNYDKIFERGTTLLWVILIMGRENFPWENFPGKTTKFCFSRRPQGKVFPDPFVRRPCGLRLKQNLVVFPVEDLAVVFSPSGGKN